MSPRATSLPVSTPLPPTPTPLPPETALGAYHEEGSGAFSHRWLAYIIEPAEDAADQSLYVELNGQRLGPYSSLSRRLAMSQGGEHIAFAAEREGKWLIVVDGEEKWEHAGLAWQWYAWTPDLEGRAFVPQTQAVLMLFSPDGAELAYGVARGDADYAVFRNGEPGPSFATLQDLAYAGERVLYTAERSDGSYLVYGDAVLGPFSSLSRLEYSPDGQHFAVKAKKAGTSLLIVDGEETTIPGELTALSLGAAGEVAYATRSGGRDAVIFGGQELPGQYDEVWGLTISPDGRRLAFWGRRGTRWSLVTEGGEIGSYERYYFYEIGGERYSILWDQSSTHVAYFALQPGKLVLHLDGKAADLPDFPGFAITVYVDEQGNSVGERLLGGGIVDRQGFVECLLQAATSDCDPLSAIMVRNRLAYVEASENTAYMVIGSQREGPYAGITSVLLPSPDHKHYAYFVRTEDGDQVVLDGQVTDLAYDGLYRPQPIGNSGLALLARKGDSMYGVFVPWP
jgi:hypothetical protein